MTLPPKEGEGMPRLDVHLPSSTSHIVCIGDSITNGDTGLGFHASRPWPQSVGRLLNAKVTACGHDGASTVDYRSCPEYGQAKAAVPSADIIVFGLGTNDVDLEHARDRDSVAKVIPRLESLVRECIGDSTRNPEIAVLSVLQFATEEPIFRERFELAELEQLNQGVDLLNAEYRCMCRRNHWHFIDYASNFNQRREYYGNSIHPNQRGYDFIARILAPRLAGLLGA
ncbi:MAG: SGNH/GDSL hydrolase family protein [Bifidobacterium sp.]|uniref:SGNH/GDSL hydrolase family protein n=1 Tax=Bifidobacterium fermentum TaxID=3059035 RepID=A0AB39UB52_9BIFI